MGWATDNFRIFSSVRKIVQININKGRGGRTRGLREL